MDRPHSRPPYPIGEGGGGTRRRAKQLSQRNLQVFQASATASHSSASSRHNPGLPDDFTGSQHSNASTVHALQRFTQSEAKEDPFPLYAREARNPAYDLNQCEQISASAQGKRRERTASVPHGDAREAGIKRHCSTSADTEAKDFACPYYKMFSRQSLPSSTCSHGFPTSTRVKEHLFRTHSLEKAGNKMSTHAKTRFCKMMFGSEEGDRLGRRSKRHSTEAEKWTAFWRILFPSQGLIPSPYLDDDASATDPHSQLSSFQAHQYATLPEKTQERCSEVMARRNYIDQPGVRELIDMLPELMRDVMKGPDSTSFPDGVRSAVDACMPVPTQSFPAADARSTTASGYPCGTQDAAAAAAASTSQQQQQQKSRRSVAARHEYPRTTVPQPEHFNHAYRIPVGTTTTTTTTTTDPGYFSADVESLEPSHPQQHHPAPAEDDAENHHDGRLHPPSSSMKQQPSYHDPNNYPMYYPSWGCSGGAMASWMQQQPSQVVGSAQADRSPTDFAGDWANEGGPLYAGAEQFDGEEEFNLDDFIHS